MARYRIRRVSMMRNGGVYLVFLKGNSIGTPISKVKDAIKLQRTLIQQSKRKEGEK